MRDLQVCNSVFLLKKENILTTKVELTVSFKL